MLDFSKLLVVEPQPGYKPAISDLVCMMNYTRYTTLQTVAGLSMAQLDHLHDADSNSIGALLMHMAAVEVYYSITTFENRSPTPEEEETWKAALDLGEEGREKLRGHDLDYYLTLLAEIRERTFAEFARRDDSWLRTTVPFFHGHPGNFYFMWFHVFEDEINHRGQIRWLRKRLP